MNKQYNFQKNKPKCTNKINNCLKIKLKIWNNLNNLYLKKFKNKKFNSLKTLMIKLKLSIPKLKIINLKF